MENRKYLNFLVDDEPGETSDMIHHPDHYTWKGAECKKVIEIMTHGLSGAEAYYMGNIIKYVPISEEGHVAQRSGKGGRIHEIPS